MEDQFGKTNQNGDNEVANILKVKLEPMDVGGADGNDRCGKWKNEN